jgi:hydrophobic/amphiphilic exporter-1 (mainly G- bacteria), HAE1 family
MKLTEVAIKRPAFMTMIFCLLAVLGLYSYLNMGVDLLPRMDWPMVFVITQYPGAGPNEVETQVSKPLEEALSSLNGVKSLRTYSNENYSFTWIEFTFSTDVNIALNDVERKVNEIRGDFPKDVKQPIISKADINAQPILRGSVTSNMEPQAFYQFMKDVIKTKIEQVEGVAGVTLVGGKQREIRVEVDNDKLKSYNLSILQVSQVLGAENLDFPTGKVTEKEKNFIVRVAGKFSSVDAIRNTILSSGPSGVVYLKDVANVIDTYKEDYTYSRYNGGNSIGIIIQKASDANAVKTSDRARKVMAKLESEYPNYNLKFVIAQDITEFTKNAVSDVWRDLGLAVLMVAIVLFLFLHSVRNSLIILLAIPTSLVSTFIMMNIFGFTVNLITLMALTLVIGILVDDSIVVLENIHRHMEMGEEKKVAAVKGRSEIGLAAIAITLVDVVVFLPIAMVSGVVGKIFKEFGLTVVVATLFSLFVSFTLTPLLASRWSKITHFTKATFIGRFILGFENMENSVRTGYRKLLNWALNHKKTVLGISFGLLLVSLSFPPFKLIGTEFMPEADRGEFALNIDMPFGTAIEVTNEATRKLEKMVSESPDVVSYYTVIGRREGAFGNEERSYLSQINIKLTTDKKRRPTQEIITEFINKSKSIPGMKVNAALIGMFGAADESPIAIEVRGAELQKIIDASEKVMDVVAKTRGTRDVRTSWEEGQPEVKVIINRERCANYNLSLGEVAMTLRNALEGDLSTKYKEGDTEYDIRILFAKHNRENPSDVANVTMINKMGQQVKLSEVADIYYGKGPTSIARKDRSRVITIQTNLDNTRPVGELMDEIDQKVKALGLPKDIDIFYAGASEDMNNMFSDMMLAITFAILFVYMIMVSLFESFIHPFTIMFSLPVALFGGLTALMLTGANLNIFTMIGVLLSMGLVTKNAILLVDYTNTLRSRGMSVREALLEAGPIRLRPIVMTSATMVFGMLPLAIGMGSGGEFRTGMAVVVIGALLSSTFLTLILVPVVYTIMDKYKERFPVLFRKINIFGFMKTKKTEQAEQEA